MKQLWVIAGANGAGKTTFYQRHVEKRNIEFINTDKPASVGYDAAIEVHKQPRDKVEKGDSFCMATVFSHPDEVSFLVEAKRRGYRVVLFYIHLGNVELNKARVEQRVAQGGRAVSHEMIESHHDRSLKNFLATIPLVDEVQVFDNARADSALRFVAKFQNGQLTDQANHWPHWAQSLFQAYLN